MRTFSVTFQHTIPPDQLNFNIAISTSKNIFFIYVTVPDCIDITFLPADYYRQALQIQISV